MKNYLFWKRFAQGKLKTHVSSVKIRMPSPKEILSWSERRLPNSALIGKVDNAHTVEHDTLKPVSGGLFCERIFGPIATNVCACSRRKGWNEEYCKVCEVQFTKSRLRRYQMGHILLAAPVVHVWALQGSYLANLLGKKNLGIRSITYGKVMCHSKFCLAENENVTDDQTSNFLSNNDTLEINPYSCISFYQKKVVPSSFTPFSSPFTLSLSTRVNSPSTFSPYSIAPNRNPNALVQTTKRWNSKEQLKIRNTANNFTSSSICCNMNFATLTTTAYGHTFVPSIEVKEVTKIKPYSLYPLCTVGAKGVRGITSEALLPSSCTLPCAPSFTLATPMVKESCTAINGKGGTGYDYGTKEYNYTGFCLNTKFDELVNKKSLSVRDQRGILEKEVKTVRVVLPKVVYVQTMQRVEKKAEIRINNFKNLTQKNIEKLYIRKNALPFYQFILYKPDSFKRITQFFHSLNKIRNCLPLPHYSTKKFCFIPKFSDFSFSHFIPTLKPISINNIFNYGNKPYAFKHAPLFHTLSLPALKGTKFVASFSAHPKPFHLPSLSPVPPTEVKEVLEIKKVMKRKAQKSAGDKGYIKDYGAKEYAYGVKEQRGKEPYTLPCIPDTPLSFRLYSFAPNTPRTAITSGTASSKCGIGSTGGKGVTRWVVAKSEKAEESVSTLPITSTPYCLYTKDANHAGHGATEYGRNGKIVLPPFSGLPNSPLAFSTGTVYTPGIGSIRSRSFGTGTLVGMEQRNKRLSRSLTKMQKNKTLNFDSIWLKPKKRVYQHLRNLGTFNQCDHLQWIVFQNPIASSQVFEKMDFVALPHVHQRCNPGTFLTNAFSPYSFAPTNGVQATTERQLSEIEQGATGEKANGKVSSCTTLLPLSTIKKNEDRNIAFTGSSVLFQVLQNINLIELNELVDWKSEKAKKHLYSFLLQNKITKKKRNLRNKLAKTKIVLTRRKNLIVSFLNTKQLPEWMILLVLPVLPPALRPILELETNNVVVSDLNVLYQTVIRRNDALAGFLTFRALEIDILNRQVSLQQAIEKLFDKGAGTKKRPLKSLSQGFHGKKGLFRLHLLGKRVDYSGRSVIVVGPRLKLYECGLPKEMALVLFLPFLIARLKKRKVVNTTSGAKQLIIRKDKQIWNHLKQLIYEHPVLLNRAPTLHRLGFQAFQPILVSGKAMILPALVCTGFNADFDGDQMAVHVPLSYAARAESWKLLYARNNMLSPATGKPIIVLSQEMILGCYSWSLVLNNTYFRNLHSSFSLPTTSSHNYTTLDSSSPLAKNDKGVRTHFFTPNIPYPCPFAPDTSSTKGGSEHGVMPKAEERVKPILNDSSHAPLLRIPPTSTVLQSPLSEIEEGTYTHLVRSIGSVYKEYAPMLQNTTDSTKVGVKSIATNEISIKKFYFTSFQEIYGALGRNDISLQTAVWLKIPLNDLFEDNSYLEEPLEIRLDSTGHFFRSYSQSQQHFSRTIKSCNQKKGVSFIRTSAGRIQLNETFYSSMGTLHQK